ncbi:MAG: hypothetical protein K9M75_01625 [Phycisphaerae bacterium]|nr:hypothetical protein [Phycisphaerae bacterium]
MDDQIEKLEIEKSQDQRFSPIVRFALIYGGILVPLLAFALGIFFCPEWQSKTIASYICLLLTPMTTWPFWPFIFYSMGSLISILINRKSVQSLAVRTGLYLGVIWSFQYIVLLTIGLCGSDNGIIDIDNRAYPFSFLVIIGFGVIVTLLPMLILSSFRKLSRESGKFINFCLILLFATVVLLVVIFLHYAILSKVFDVHSSGMSVGIGAMISWSIIICLSLLIYAYRKTSNNKFFIILKCLLDNKWFCLLFSSIIILIAIILLVLTIIANGRWPEYIPTSILFLAVSVVFSSLIPAPFWCFSIYLYFSIYEHRKSDNEKLSELIKLKPTCNWLGGYAVAWGFSIASTLIFYRILPKHKPSGDCYIATAAARGHRRFVGSEDIILADGEVMSVNTQLRRLKCGELMLKSSLPWLHRLFRLIYDALGPRLAVCLVHPALADMTYIMLKPAEWIVCAILLIMHGKCNVAERFYTGVKH